MNVDIDTYSAKLEGCRARAHVYRAEIMYLWFLVVTCDQINIVIHAGNQINDLSDLWPGSDNDTLGYLG